MKHWTKALRCAVGVVVGLLALQVWGQCEQPARLSFSLIPQGDPAKDMQAYGALVAAIEARTGRRVNLVMPQSYGSVVEGLVAGSLDFAILGPASYLKARQASPDVRVFASYAKRGGAYQEEGPYYRSLLVVRSEGPFKEAGDLKGTVVALTDPVSTSGAVLPRKLFPQRVGQSLDSFFGRVAYVGDHDRAGVAVASGKVDAAFVSSFHLSELVRQGRVKADELRVLWRSEPIPQDAIVIRQRLCPALQQQIREAFLDRNGQAYPELLERQGTLRFVPMDDEAYRILQNLN